MAASDYVSHDHVAVFRAAARHFNVFIAVRQTNAHSLPYVTRPGYAAKRFDCKAKTAKGDVVLKGRPRKTAGLVVDWDVMGDQRAVAYGDGLREAEKAWKAFSSYHVKGIHDEYGKPRYTYVPGGKLYWTQEDPASAHYGCVQFASSSLITAGVYIHGDYDLYAIVPADARSQTTYIVNPGWGNIEMPHARGKELYDVQIYINSHCGRPMVLHGDQEKYKAHEDDNLVVFFPDGVTEREYRGKAAIETLYRTVFEGRKTGTPMEPREMGWRTV
jgi:hypothetical protein